MKRFVLLLSLLTLASVIVNRQVVFADRPISSGVQDQSSSDILDSSFFKPPYFLPLVSPQVSPTTVIQRGERVPFHTVLNDPYWERPVFRSYWDTSVSGGRWSKLPIRVHYALHRVFASPMNPSTYYDFVHNVGIVDEMKGVPIHESRVFEQMMFVVVQSDVSNVYRMGNQLVITADPQRTGLHVFTIKSSDIPSMRSKEPTLVQLVTHDGQPLDYWMLGNLG